MNLPLQWRDEHAEKMNVHADGSLFWLSFPRLDQEPWLRNAFSTRTGGISSGHLSSLNLGIDRGDDPEHVRENFRRIARAAGFRPEHMVFSRQTHTTNLLRVGRAERGAGYDYPRPWNDIDGFVTDEPGVVLVTFYADCVPLYLADPVHHAIGLAHSGWRGTANQMGRVLTERMRAEFGSRPEDLLAAIGPSICTDCYEVSSEVASYFPKKTTLPGREGHAQLDLTEANRLVFSEAGIPAGQISISNLCTSCNADLLFSHRASGGRRGNLAAFLEIREPLN